MFTKSDLKIYLCEAVDFYLASAYMPAMVVISGRSDDGPVRHVLTAERYCPYTVDEIGYSGYPYEDLEPVMPGDLYMVQRSAAGVIRSLKRVNISPLGLK